MSEVNGSQSGSTQPSDQLSVNSAKKGFDELRLDDCADGRHPTSISMDIYEFIERRQWRIGR